MSKDEALVKIGADLQAEALAYPKYARELVVTNDQELEAADEFVKGGKALIKEIRAGYDDIINDWHKGWKNSIAKRDHYLKPVSDGVETAKGKMAPYMEEQWRKVREAEEKARRAEEEVEAKQRAIEEERQKAAREAFHDGEVAKAAKILAKPVPEIVPETVDIPQVKELKGTHARVTWDWELEDINLVPRSFLQLDRVVINKEVQEYKESTKIPGIRVFQKTGVSTRG